VTPESFRDHPAAHVSPHLVELSSTLLYGDLWERPQLSKRDRSLATLSALIAGGRPGELKGHVKRGLANGLTRDEIGELLLHLAFYSGWPAAAGAVTLVKEAYDELDGVSP
jgi:4-carboxymuconolactone decarboxylase